MFFFLINQNLDQKRRQGDDRTTEQLNTSSNSFLQSNDKENSILDEILVPETQQQSQSGQVLGFVSVLLFKRYIESNISKKISIKVHQPNPSDFSQIFDDEPSHPSGNRSTPLKVLSPNKRVSAIETPQKGNTVFNSNASRTEINFEWNIKLEFIAKNLSYYLI